MSLFVQKFNSSGVQIFAATSLIGILVTLFAACTSKKESPQKNDADAVAICKSVDEMCTLEFAPVECVVKIPDAINETVSASNSCRMNISLNKLFCEKLGRPFAKNDESKITCSKKSDGTEDVK